MQREQKCKNSLPGKIKADKRKLVCEFDNQRSFENPGTREYNRQKHKWTSEEQNVWVWRQWFTSFVDRKLTEKLIRNHFVLKSNSQPISGVSTFLNWFFIPPSRFIVSAGLWKSLHPGILLSQKFESLPEARDPLYFTGNSNGLSSASIHCHNEFLKK